MSLSAGKNNIWGHNNYINHSISSINNHLIIFTLKYQSNLCYIYMFTALIIFLLTFKSQGSPNKKVNILLMYVLDI